MAPPEKSPFGRQFTGKNPPRPVVARAGGVFAGKLSTGDFSGRGDPIMGRLYGAGDILIRGKYINYTAVVHCRRRAITLVIIA